MFVVQQCQLLKIKRSLSKDLRTRWNSSYLMIASLIDLRAVIEKLLSAKHHLNLRNEQIDALTELEINSTEWNHLVQLRNILQGFFHARKNMSGRTYPSIGSAYFILTKLKNYLADDKNGNPLVKRLKSSSATKLVHYFEEDRSQLNLLKVSQFLVDYPCSCSLESRSYCIGTKIRFPINETDSVASLSHGAYACDAHVSTRSTLQSLPVNVTKNGSSRELRHSL